MKISILILVFSFRFTNCFVLPIPNQDLSSVITSLMDGCKDISKKIQTASCNKLACFNDFGDEQLAIDVLANEILINNLLKNDKVATISSEETSSLLLGEGSEYSVAFDPLDGSSIIDNNFAVGTIFGIWKGDKLTYIKGRELCAAGICVYGPRTTISIATDQEEGAKEYLLCEDGSWKCTRNFNNIGPGKLYSPGNLRCIGTNPKYKKLVDYYSENKYQLRYTGGMVPDVNQILIQGKGIFLYPESSSYKSKLRMLYELAPIAYLIEKAGGASSNGQQSILDLEIKHTNDVSQVAIGSKSEIERFNKIMNSKVNHDVFYHGIFHKRPIN